MPCAAPCDRLPCDQRCAKVLSCGHRCPGVCGEPCAEGYCHQCSDKFEARVDLLEMKSYGDTDVDETPVVVLGCGHFFTTESLDGLVGLSEVYEVDHRGNFIGLQGMSGAWARAIPCCPDCKCPIRQFATQRYNRVINRAVMDEMSKRFLTTGRDQLRDLERQIMEVGRDLETSREQITRPVHEARLHVSSTLTPAKRSQITRILAERYDDAKKLETAVQKFCNGVADKYRPAQKLQNAIVHMLRKTTAANTGMDILTTNMNVLDIGTSAPRDHRITMGGRMMEVKTKFIILNDRFIIVRALESVSTEDFTTVSGGDPDLLATPFLQNCKSFIDECVVDHLPKLAVEASLCYASIARSFESFCRSRNTRLEVAATHMDIAKKLLVDAREVCKQPFDNAEDLLEAVEELIRLIGRARYEEVTSEEIQAIKTAMLSGSRGIATHSGHWYNCENGHPVSFLPLGCFEYLLISRQFAIGECGMPMEVARCPECGASVGGQNHTAVSGVTRARDMET